MRRWSTMGYVLIAFACALALWFYVADYDRITEVEIKNVEVDLILPSNEALSVESGYNNQITVKLSGRKADLEGITSKDLHAYIDLSGIKRETNRAFEVQFDNLPSGVTVTNSRDIPKITVVLVESVVKDFDIVANIKHDVISGPNYIVTDCTPSQVKITGSASVINSIAKAEVSADVGALGADGGHVNGTIVLRDEKGNVVPQTYLDLDHENVTVYAYLFTEKEFDVKVKIEGFNYGDDGNKFKADVTWSPATVKIRGPLLSVEEASRKYNNEITITVNETDIVGSDYTCKVPMPDLYELFKSESVKYVDKDGREVDMLEDAEVTIKNAPVLYKQLYVSKEDMTYNENPEYTVNVTGIRVDGGEFDDAALVEFFGPTENMENITVNDLNFGFALEKVLKEFAASMKNGETLVLDDVSLGTKSGILLNDDSGVFTTKDIRISLEIVYTALGDGDEESSEGITEVSE